MIKKAPLVGLLTLILIFLVAFRVSKSSTRGSSAESVSDSVSGSTSESEGRVSANPELTSHETKAHGQVKERSDQRIKRTAILDTETKSLMIDCAHKLESGSTVRKVDEFQTLNEYLDKSIDLTRGRMIRVLQYRNIHLLSANGQRVRLSIQPVSNPGLTASTGSDDSAGYEIHLAQQNDDGIYGSTPLPNDLKSLSIEQTVARFKSQGQVVFDEVSETRAWGKKIAAHVIYRDGQVENLEVFSPLGSLVCARIAGQASAECQCRN